MKKNQIIRNKTTGETLTMLVSDEENGGTCQLYEVHLPPHRPGPPLHYPVDFLFSHSKAMSRIEQFVAESNRSSLRSVDTKASPSQSSVDMVRRPRSVCATLRPSVTSSNAPWNGLPSTTNVN